MSPKATKTPNDPSFSMRFVDVQGHRYLRLEDVAAFVRELGGGEETDVRRRLYTAADNLIAGSRKGGR